MTDLLNMQQRSAEWFKARLGLVTSSNFADVMAGRDEAAAAYARWHRNRSIIGAVASGMARKDAAAAHDVTPQTVGAAIKAGVPDEFSHDPPMAYQTYLNHVVAERISGELAENYTGADAERGIAYEDEAILAYEFQVNTTVKRIGMVRNDIAGASPDGLVGEYGLVEVKAPRRHHYIRMILSDDPAANYRPQIQGQLWLSERAWCDLCLYAPPLPLFIRRVLRDDDYIAELAVAVAAFETDVAKACVEARRIIHTNEPLDQIEELTGPNPWREQ